ncbi:DUF1345 domain-containing protein [Terrihabitans rhizophilus]|uniref:DUF1345 domain-containing protein n=1 Tax=Terrihabitans rhizophilus TaxID=3092662 RepID=A0ABU4RRC1_9HYPH|nr:DUF1345 domain-containing protein [Terrihabitans sp. PJ23]MDX6807397.1 DUF1345 domain-containing protein [Terrihabitans sp. PJ23]
MVPVSKSFLTTRLPHFVGTQPRILLCMALTVVAFILGGSFELSTRLLLAWNFGALLYLVLAGSMMLTASADHIRQRSDDLDPAAWIVTVLTVIAALASLGATGFELHAVKAATGDAGWRIMLAGSTIIVSWFFLHTLLALHYAHDHYNPDTGIGLKFPDDPQEPTYWDFLYFSFTIGAAAQTSDVEVASSRLRRVVLAHTILAFLFNTAILALAINVGAGLL